MYETLFALTVIFVVAAFLLVIAAQRGLPVIPFYLFAGIVAGFVIDESQLLDLAQWGIAFLVFLFGAHIDLETFGSTGRISVAVGVLQAAIVGGVAFGVAVAFGVGPLNAGYFAIAAALSSSLVATSYLGTTDGIRPTNEQLAESIHFTEDVLGVAIVVALSAFVYAAAPVPTQLAVAAGLFALALGIRYLVFHRLTARLRGNSEVMMLVGITFAIGFVALAEAADLSIVIGAFAAGIAIADDYPHSLELIDTISDLEDFFTPIFFVTVGALALYTPPTIETLGYTVGLVVAVVLLNPLVVGILLLRKGFDGRTAVLTALSLDQVSVFTLFIAIEALIAGTISRPLFDAIVLSAAVTILVASYTARNAEAINRWLRDRGLVRAVGKPIGEKTSVDDDLEDHVIVVDFEHGGEHVLDACAELDRPVLVVEDNPTRFDDVREHADNYVYGDVLNDETWRVARLDEAALVVSLTPETARAESILDRDTGTPRIVRVDTADDADRFADLGAAGTVYPDAMAAERVGDDLEALLDEELSREEFVERSRLFFENPP
jgi:monovalent cation:H+ antiporter-2, CPA2 family